ncbi:GIY-YIG nuclease family protein [Pseudomonas sp.]|uniref:GIY-YIG nuclease family protein n=1 Tax=Pseudomonas sp. TaxID=306 RepID=UPI00271C7251|nr:GIY-YIG nuclease family protein [Pseudomonas sp.]MDO8709774.1 GIY-YIG nuclease family protein [Pseudomonas sp.]
MPSVTIKIFLANGDPKRLRTAELSNWTGKAIAGPRSEFEGVLAREESHKSGVYFLTGIDPETGKSAVYIGEAESVRDRLKSHLEKDFWNHVVFFTSKDENLTKAHIRYLEGRLIEQAKQAARSIVKNGQNSGARLPESDREDMEIFLGKIHQLLPVLGVEVLVPITAVAASANELELLSCEIKGLKATGHLTPNGMVVLASSQAVLNERPSSQKYPWPVNMRQRLKDDGILTVKDDHLLFAQNHEFSSPSAAAAVIHGGHANGLTAWKNKNGKTLKELESVSGGGRGATLEGLLPKSE